MCDVPGLLATRISSIARIYPDQREHPEAVYTILGGCFVLPKNVNPGPRDVSASDMWNHARSRDQEMRHVFPACLDA